MEVGGAWCKDMMGGRVNAPIWGMWGRVGHVRVCGTCGGVGGGGWCVVQGHDGGGGEVPRPHLVQDHQRVEQSNVLQAPRQRTAPHHWSLH